MLSWKQYGQGQTRLHVKVKQDYRSRSNNTTCQGQTILQVEVKQDNRSRSNKTTGQGQLVFFY